MKEITRQDYMADSSNLHEEYWKQFVTPSVYNIVWERIGKDKIKASTDKYFNDIPLHLWDRLDLKSFIDRKKFARLENGITEYKGIINWSSSDNVCIAKAAARMIKES